MIPRPYARGDENNLVKWMRSLPMFQSTPLRERRLNVGVLPMHIRKVSIHAPTREATQRGDTTTVIMTFQSTPLREGRLTNFRY